MKAWCMRAPMHIHAQCIGRLRYELYSVIRRGARWHAFSECSPTCLYLLRVA
jgi:hypothetical protein